MFKCKTACVLSKLDTILKTGRIGTYVFSLSDSAVRKGKIILKKKKKIRGSNFYFLTEQGTKLRLGSTTSNLELCSTKVTFLFYSDASTQSFI